MKRVVSILLAALLVITCLPLAVIATGAEEYAFSSDFATDKNITYDAEAATISYEGPWTFSLIDPAAKALVAVTRTNHHSVREVEHPFAITELAYSGIQTNGWSMFVWGSHPGSGGLNVEDHSITFSNGQTIPAYVYTVGEEGSYNIYPSVSSFTAPAEGILYYFSIFVNEKQVWPIYGGEVVNASPYEVYSCADGTWYEIDSTTTIDELNTALADATFAAGEGDRIEFAFRFGGVAGESDLGEALIDLREDGGVQLTPAFGAKALTGDEVAPRYVLVKQDGVAILSQKVTAATFTAPAYTGSYIFLGWDANGDGTADYSAGEEVPMPVLGSLTLEAVTVGMDSFRDNYPVLQDGVVTFHGNWTIGRYGVKTNTYELYTVPDGGGNIITVTGSPWGNTGGGLYVSGDVGKFALSGATASGEWAGQIQYTVPYNGNITLDFSKLQVRRELNGNYADASTAGGFVEGKIEYDFAIYKNGVKVWPSATDWWRYDSVETYTVQTQTNNILDLYHAALETDPLAIDVKVGDTIELRVRQGNAECWMVFCDPIISYNQVTDTPMVRSTGVTISKDLTLNINVALNSQFTRPGAVAGILVWNEAQENFDPATGEDYPTPDAVNGENSTFAITGIAAKEMADDIYVMPYSYVPGEVGSVIYGPVSACSIARYGEAALKIADAEEAALIAALLNYGTDAQNLFDYNRTNPANACLSDEQKEAGALIAESVYAQSSDGTTGVNIKSVSLLMNDRLGMKFMVDAKAGVESYTLQVSRTADFAEYDEVEMIATELGDEYKGAYAIDNADINTTYYIRVATGEGAYGNVLTYSAASYIARMNESASDTLYYALYWLSVIANNV